MKQLIVKMDQQNIKPIFSSPKQLIFKVPEKPVNINIYLSVMLPVIYPDAVWVPNCGLQIIDRVHVTSAPAIDNIESDLVINENNSRLVANKYTINAEFATCNRNKIMGLRSMLNITNDAEDQRYRSKNSYMCYIPLAEFSNRFSNPIVVIDLLPISELTQPTPEILPKLEYELLVGSCMPNCWALEIYAACPNHSFEIERVYITDSVWNAICELEMLLNKDPDLPTMRVFEANLVKVKLGSVTKIPLRHLISGTVLIDDKKWQFKLAEGDYGLIDSNNQKFNNLRELAGLDFESYPNLAEYSYKFKVDYDREMGLLLYPSEKLLYKDWDEYLDAPFPCEMLKEGWNEIYNDDITKRVDDDDHDADHVHESDQTLLNE